MTTPRPEDQLGSRFVVREASRCGFGIEASGYVVFLKGKDLAIWTGSVITLPQAAERLLIAEMRASRDALPAIG